MAIHDRGRENQTLASLSASRMKLQAGEFLSLIEKLSTSVESRAKTLHGKAGTRSDTHIEISHTDGKTDLTDGNSEQCFSA